MPGHRIFSTPFAAVYPLYIEKARRKGRTKEEVDRVICWLTGYDHAGLLHQIEQRADFETFFAQAPAMNPNSSLIKGVVCGVANWTSSSMNSPKAGPWRRSFDNESLLS